MNWFSVCVILLVVCLIPTSQASPQQLRERLNIQPAQKHGQGSAAIASVASAAVGCPDSSIYGGYNNGGSTIIVGSAPNTLLVNMRGRPQAYGHYNPVTNTGEVTFPDDKTYTFIYDIFFKRILWSNKTIWNKTALAIYGNYGDATIEPGASGGNTLIVTWSNGRPQASGHYNYVNNTGEVTFPDDKTYTYTFNTATGIIDWSNKTQWKKKF